MADIRRILLDGYPTVMVREGESLVARDGRSIGVDDAVGDDNTVALRAFNDKAAADDRVEVVVLPAFDGLTIARKL